MSAEAPAAGIYVHVPFCRRRCHFCSFAITTHRDFEQAWTAGLLAEIEARRADWSDLSFDTVYFGGGTPSLLPAERLLFVLDALRSRFSISPAAEITVEANPGDLDRMSLDLLRGAGVNRLSIGVQSFSDEDLAFLTRQHTGEEGHAAIRGAKEAGFSSVSVDLLYGLPGRPDSRWREQIEHVAEHGVPHVSAYLLSIEPGTPFFARAKRGALARLSEDEEGERFLVTRRWLREAGYEPYEVSNFARSPELESRHNRKYWDGAPCLGLGPSAVSFRPPATRLRNESAVRRWAMDPAAPAGREDLTPEQLRLERLFLGLRTAKGIPRTLAGDRAGRFVTEGLAEWRGDCLVLTDEGFAVADGIAVRL